MSINIDIHVFKLYKTNIFRVNMERREEELVEGGEVKQQVLPQQVNLVGVALVSGSSREVINLLKRSLQVLLHQQEEGQ